MLILKTPLKSLPFLWEKSFWALTLSLVTMGLVFGFYYLSPSLTGGRHIASLDSSWSGNALIARSTGRLALTGQSPVTIVSIPITLAQNTWYEFVVAAQAPAPLHVDLMAPGYDNPTQEILLQPPLQPADFHRFSFNSGESPTEASLRLFYEGPAEVTLGHFEAYQVNAGYRLLKVLLIGIPIILWGIYFWQATARATFVAVCLGAVALGLYLVVADRPAPAGQGGDNMWYVPTADSLLRNGSFDLSGSSAQITKVNQYGVQSYADGKVISLFPIGTPIVITPFLVLAHLLHLSDWDAGEAIAKLFAAISVSLLFLCLWRLGLDIRFAILVTIVFAFASSHFSLHAGGLWSHNTSLLLSLIYLLLLLDSRISLNLLAAPIGVLGYISRPDFSLLILAGAAYFFFERRHLLLAFLLLVGLSVTPFVCWSLGTFGTIIPEYYRTTRLQLGPQMLPILFGQFFSPNRGLLIFNPFVLLGFIGGICSFFFKIEHRRFYQALCTVCLLHALAISAFPHWWGGFSYGPRLFAPVLGLLFVLIVPLLQMLPRSAVVLQRSVLIFGVMAALWGAFVHGRGATAQSVHSWNAVRNIDEHPGLLWSWKDMEIFY